MLDFVPSSWYSDDEAKTHLTAEQLKQAEIDQKAEAKKFKAQRAKQLKKDFEKILTYAEIFVKANERRVNKRASIEKFYWEESNYVGIVKMWEHDLLDEQKRQYFVMLDEVLAMP